MADEEVSEKISLHTLDDGEERASVKELTWREKLAKLMTTNKVQYTIIVLVVLDSLIVVFELLIDMEIITIPEDHHHETTTTASNTSINGSQLTNDSDLMDPHHPTHHNTSFLQPLHNHSHSLINTAITATFNHSRNGSTTTYPHPEDGEAEGGHGEHGKKEGGHADPAHHAPNKHLTEHILHMASLTILTIFLVEVMFKIMAEGKHLLKHKAEVFDAVVVVVSFTMDITFMIVPVDQATQDYAGLLVLLRLWRVTRIINGVILSVKMDADKKLKAQKALRAKAEKQVQRLTNKLETLTRENQKLRTRIALLERGGGEGGNGEVGRGEAEGDGGGGDGGCRETSKDSLATLEEGNCQPTAEMTSHHHNSHLTSASSPLDEMGMEWAEGGPVVTANSHSLDSPRSRDSVKAAGMASTPLREKRLFGRESPSVVRSAPSLSTPPSCRGESGKGVGGGGGGLLTPTESQQLLSFEEPVSESQDMELSEPQVNITPSLTGKLVPGVS